MNVEPVEILAEALDEIASAKQWYAEQSVVAGERIILEVQQALAEIRDAPDRWPKYLRGTRRYRLNRFPYLMVYRVRGTKIEIVAFHHGKRRPGYWRDRIKR